MREQQVAVTRKAPTGVISGGGFGFEDSQPLGYSRGLDFASWRSAVSTRAFNANCSSRH